ncbi:MmcB family DNA repair protein [Pararhodobacter sp. SW119]|uniref:MmcB family DNA repair protein n=1 Tax=Pararhodobacter sp. SW119 TaxID=2780075 RepID=UPI001AE0CB7F|nr:MmcB family DNA repair protein [Pararhodobacter sp. SW119]
MERSVEPILPNPGQRLARGVCRALRALDFAALEEVTPEPGLRVDVMALGPGGEIWIVECKSCLSDYRADRKWQGYLPWCDRFFWAVGADFPTQVLPDESGLILADDFDAEIVRPSPPMRLAPARRRALTLRFARMAAYRHHFLRDPRA